MTDPKTPTPKIPYLLYLEAFSHVAAGGSIDSIDDDLDDRQTAAIARSPTVATLL